MQEGVVVEMMVETGVKDHGRLLTLQVTPVGWELDQHLKAEKQNVRIAMPEVEASLDSILLECTGC
jgi:hypothetical protein